MRLKSLLGSQVRLGIWRPELLRTRRYALWRHDVDFDFPAASDNCPSTHLVVASPVTPIASRPRSGLCIHWTALADVEFATERSADDPTGAASTCRPAPVGRGLNSMSIPERRPLRSMFDAVPHAQGAPSNHLPSSRRRFALLWIGTRCRIRCVVV